MCKGLKLGMEGLYNSDQIINRITKYGKNDRFYPEKG